MSYNLAELVDIENIKKLLISINKVTNIPLFIIDNKGKYIVETSWSNLCKNFHKKNFESKRLCIDSNRKLMKLSKGKNYSITTCANGLIDIGIPLYINNEHVATILIGQFFMEEPNIDFFTMQAKKFGFNINDYLQALKKIPIYSTHEVEKVLELVLNIKNFISDFADEQLKVRNANDALEYNNDLLQKIKETYKLVLSTTHEGVYDCNLLTGEIYFSPMWKQILGFDKNYDLNNINDWLQLLHPENKAEIEEMLHGNFNNNDVDYVSEYRVKDRQDEYFWVKDKGIIIRDKNGLATRAIGSIMDISERKAWERALYEAAFFDDLTGLPNISHFKNELEGSLKNENSGAVYYVDIDDFKKVNDLVGHKFGDELLLQVSLKLKEIINGRGIVCRFGGDEFLILEENVEDKKLVIETAERISNIFKNSIELNGFKFYITASIGITFFPEQSSEVNEIIKHSDNAVNRAKGKGKNTYEFYQPEMFSEILNRTETEKYLREALEKDQFIINYQPIVDVKTGEILSFEALLRWISPVLGFVPPDKFIPIAEETGLIVEIGYWVLEHVCNQIKLWNIKGYIFEYISINVSEVQFQQENFVDLVKNAVFTACIDPKYLALEITESIMIKSMEKNISTLRKLNSIGIKTMMDDFGTGYSSLNYLMKIPINSLKIDKSFIDEICMNPKQEAITEGIITLAHNINLDVIAEGVEIEDQRNLLNEKNCDKIQGYFFSRPVSVEAAEDMLKSFVAN